MTGVQTCALPISSLRLRRAVLAIALLLGACKVTDDASFRRASADRLPAPAGSSARAELEPGDEPIPEGQLGTSIRRGRAIVMATRESLPRNVGNGLRCVSCHLDEGRRPVAAFIRHNMPGDRRESLSTREAIDVAVFLAARTRPRLAGQEGDWPLGNEPDDVPYWTTASRLQRAARARPGT